MKVTYTYLDRGLRNMTFINLAADVPYKNMNRLDASVLGSGHGFVLTAKKVRKQKHRTMTKNSSFENQIILREEETEITDIEETSITELRSDLSQGSPDNFEIRPN